MFDYIGAYLERDVRQVSNVIDLAAFRKLLVLAAGRAAQEINHSRLGGDAGVTQSTARSWVSVLETSFVCFLLPAWHRNVRKQQIKAPKLHFFDTGIVCALLGIRSPEQLRTYPGFGSIFETWVASEVLKARYNRGLGRGLFHYRESRGLEVDLVVAGRDLSLVEAKSGETIVSEFFRPLRQLSKAIEDQGSPIPRSIVVYGGAQAQRRSDAMVLPWNEIHSISWDSNDEGAAAVESLVEGRVHEVADSPGHSGLFLSKLRPSDLRPELLIDREREAEWLEHGLSAYLADRDPEQGQAFAILGAKGVGKSIFTRRVLQKLREIHTSTVFVGVDCRGALRQRKVFKQIAERIHAELVSMQRAGVPIVATELAAGAAVVKILAGLDHIERKSVHDYLSEYWAALGPSSLLVEQLSSVHQISLGRPQPDSVEGLLVLDDDDIREMLVLLIRDIRRHHRDLDLVIHLENIDGLDHDAGATEASREQLRVQTLGLMQLCRAPVGLVLDMRTYYAGILPREVSKRRELAPLDAAKLGEVLERRIVEETTGVRQALGTAPWVARRRALAELASTPLSLLSWFEYLAESIAEPETRPLTELLPGFALMRGATLGLDRLLSITRAFGTRDATISRAQLLVACGGSEALRSQAIRSQIVLPRDFWEPEELTLDPELHFFLAPPRAEP